MAGIKWGDGMSNIENTALPVERTADSKRSLAIVYLRCIAALLIINSHISDLYPKNLSFLGFGGLFGNLLFIFISGYCLANVKGNYFPWLKKRFLRIYVPYIMIGIIRYLSTASSNPVRAVVNLFFPYRTYHFIASILVLYLIWFPLSKLMQKKKSIAVGFLMFFLLFSVISYYFIIDYKSYTLTTHFNVFEITLYLVVMTLGFFARNLKFSYKPLYSILSVIVIGASFGAFTFFRKYVTNPVLTIVTCYIGLLFVLALSYFVFSVEKYLIELNVVEFIASITLELYLVQRIIVGVFKTETFPLRFVFGLLCIVGMAYILKCIADAIIDLPKTISEKKKAKQKPEAEKSGA